MLTPQQIRWLKTNPDYVALPRFGNSLAAVVERYPDGAPTRVIQQALGLADEEEVRAIYDRAALRLLRLVDPDAYEERVMDLEKALRALLGEMQLGEDQEEKSLSKEEEKVVEDGNRLLRSMKRLREKKNGER